MTLPRVFGVGSFHGDDQAGWLVIDQLKELGYPRSLLRKLGNPADLMDEISPALQLLVCDACQGDKVAGKIHHWSWPTDSLTELRASGTHNLTVPHVLQLADELGRCPESVEIWGIAGWNWSPASQPGLPVQFAVREVAQTIWRRYHA